MARSFEVRVDDWVRERLNLAGLVYHTQHDLPSDLSAALEKASKSGTGAGNPDFATIPREGTLCVIIENKYGIDKLESRNDKGVLLKTKKAVNDYATNGALHYGQKILESGKFKEVIAIGIAGETTEKGLENLEVASSVHYMFSANDEPKFIDKKITSFDFLDDDNFYDFYQEISLSDEEKSRVLDKSYSNLQKTAKDLNRLFYDHSITVEQRVVFVSGMLLAMQNNLTPDHLVGAFPGSSGSDGSQIYTQIETLLRERVRNEDKRNMMLSTFSTLKADLDRDRKREGKTITRGPKKGEKTPGTSINKEIFTFIYENVFLTIDQSSHLDSLGEMYSSFLKYALGDGKENGIVLTPPYVTKAMCEMIGINRDSRVFDPCTGSGGFLVTAMSEMIEDARNHHHTLALGKEETKNKIKEIQENQLMGLENDLKMFSLASTNMILRGDGSTTILKGSTFDLVKEREVKDFAPTRALLNPPFSYSENGMPFTLATLDIMDKDGRVALIIQDSAGTGKSISTNKKILENHTLLASIRMPGDLFEPSAGVQTSIYLFQAHVPHDVRKKVRFIDFSDDGYKRTGRGLRKISNPDERYEALKEVIKYGASPDGVDIPFIDDVITLNGDDWNYTQHQVFDTVPKEEDFLKTVGDYMGFELSLILSGKGDLIGFSDEDMKKAEEEASGNA